VVSFGGLAELSASTLFSFSFLACLLLAFRAIRANDMVRHRRWMIRAFAIGIGVGTIRIWTGLFLATGLLELTRAIGLHRLTADAVRASEE
jgi:hypothetical protein